MAVFPRVRTYKGVERKVWIAKWKDRGGKWRQREFERKKDAEHYEREMIREVGLGIHVPDRLTKTFGQACEAWLEDNERRHRVGDRMTGYSLINYRGGARRHVLPELAAVPLTRLTHELLQEVIDRRAAALSNPLLVRIIQVIRLTLNFAIRRGWLVASPLTHNPLRLPARREERVVPPPMEDLHKILAALDQKPWNWKRSAFENRRLIVLLALYAGLRRGEICGLQWEDVDFEDGVIRVRHSLSTADGLKAPKSKAGVRTVPMPTPLREALLRHAATRRMEGYVLTDADSGRPLPPLRVSDFDWPQVLRVAGLVTAANKARYSLHSLRHAYVSMLLAAGYSLWHVSRLVGHADTYTTERVYGHMLPTDETHRRAALTVSTMIEAARPPEPPVIADKPAAQLRSEALRAAVLALHREGLSIREIARRIDGVSFATVRLWTKGAALALPAAAPELPVDAAAAASTDVARVWRKSASN